MKKKTRRGMRQKGFSLVELMVGLAVGTLAVLASYMVFEGVDRNSRAVETINNAQITGLYATFMINQEVGNAGAGIMSNFAQLQGCMDVANFPNDPSLGAQAFPLYPLPVAIIPDGGRTDGIVADDIFVFYGTGSITDLAVPVTRVSGNTISLTAPLGVAIDSVLVGLAQGGGCGAFIAEVVNTSSGMDVTVGTAQTPSVASRWVVDLGNAVRRQFFVDNQGTLQMRTWAATPSGDNSWQVTRTDPIATNVVFFRAQYGISATRGGPITQWVAPDVAGPATFAQIMAGTPSAQNITAIRFGLIVRADEPDRALGNTLGAQDSYTETLFADCPVGGTCSLPEVISLVVSESGDAFGWRYRKYETIVPLRNAVWN